MSKVIVYGGSKTIHHSKDLQIEINQDGIVVAVWFRCMALPFTQSQVDHNRSDEMLRHYKDGSNAEEILGMVLQVK